MHLKCSSLRAVEYNIINNNKEGFTINISYFSVVPIASPQASLLQRCPIAMLHLVQISKSRGFAQNRGKRTNIFCFRRFSFLNGSAGES